MPPVLTPAARLLLRRQRGLIADWQSPDVGLSRDRLMRATRSGWARVTPHVFADQEHDVSEDQLRVAGLLEGGPLAVLSGSSALIEAGWQGSSRGWVDLIEPRGQRRRMRGQPVWLRRHQPRNEVRGSGFPRRAGAGRAAVDAAAWAASDREAVMILASAVQQRIVGCSAIRRALTQRYAVHRTDLIRDAIADIEGGATSSNEIAFVRECRRRGLPRPRMQVRRVGGSRRTDAEFATGTGRLLIVEIDGIGHLDPNAWREDLVRHNELSVTTGALVLRVSGWEVRNDPDPFFTLLAEALNAQW